MSTETAPAASLKPYDVKCHCGKFAYSFEHDPLEEGKPISCNCSICSTKAYIFAFPQGELKFSSGTLDGLTAYQFGKKNYTHYFCPTCGSPILCASKEPAGNAVNLRFVQGLDTKKMTPQEYDGASL